MIKFHIRNSVVLGIIRLEGLIAHHTTQFENQKVVGGHQLSLGC